MNNPEQTPRVSVVMPVYNAEAYLPECIESVLAQTFTNFEFIIIDDDSDDNSREIIHTYTRDPRIVFFHNRHDMIESLNKGITLARGKYIARMDNDDIMLPERLEKQVQFMEAHPEIDICSSYMESFGMEQKPMYTYTFHKEILAYTIISCPLFHPTLFFKRSLVEKFPVKSEIIEFYHPDYMFADDYKLYLDLISHGAQFGCIPEILMKYRKTETQITHRHAREVSVKNDQIQLEYIQYVMEKMVNRQEDYRALFEELICLTNRSLISFRVLKEIIYKLYSAYLIHHDS